MCLSGKHSSTKVLSVHLSKQLLANNYWTSIHLCKVSNIVLDYFIQINGTIKGKIPNIYSWSIFPEISMFVQIRDKFVIKKKRKPNYNYHKLWSGDYGFTSNIILFCNMMRI